MGLDMYLTKRVYVGNKWREPEQRVKIKYPKTDKDVAFQIKRGSINEEKISAIEEEAAYWRKANAIHSWFVTNVQSGVDDCGEYSVPIAKLEELVALCKRILSAVETDVPLPSDASDWDKWSALRIKNKSHFEEMCAELLPTESGFFFGNTSYGGEYLFDLQHTIDQLEPLVKKDADGDYINSHDMYYQSSW